MSESEEIDGEPTVRRVRELLREREWGRLAGLLGFARAETPVPEGALGAWGIPEELADAFDAMRLLAADDGYRVMLVEGVDRYSDLRRALLGAHRRNPSECVIWWLVGEREVTVASVDTGPEGRPFVRRMETDIEEADPVALRQWTELYADDLPDADLADPGRAYGRHVHDVLRQEAVTREFFERFREALGRLTDELERGPEEEQLRHDVALATLLRLVFLYFLQERGALDGDRRFVVRHYREAIDAGVSFYDETLRPLFFGALNRTAEHRTQRARELGELPFLNGGLFEPLPAEREYPDLTWPNEVWSEVVEELLERFQFAVDEGVGPDENRAVDPEMLGKVFEGLMYGERRHDSGSFYTPRDVVRSVVSEALVEYAAGATELSREEIRRVVGGEGGALEAPQRRKLAALLESFHLLDPAVGTGAFLLEAMRALERFYRACGGEEGRERYELRRHVVHEHLFGVDVQKTAVRICELRIWLALLSVMPEGWSIDEIPALPNLSHRIACGNSLMAPEDRVRMAAGAGGPCGGAFSSTSQLRDRHRREMVELQESFLEAHGDEKVELRRRMERLERNLQRDVLEARRARLREKCEPLEKLETSRDLFGRAVELEEAQRRRKEELEAEIEAIDSALEEMESGRAEIGGFSYAARFGPSLDEQGFDVVVTNPPWVRANRLERSRRRQLRSRYGSYTNDLWAGADAAGVSVPFGAQVDLAALFVERSLELLRPGGRLGALVPSKLFRSLHGSGLRGLLAEHRVDAICDYSDGDRKMFDATVYPATLHVRKAPSESRRPRRGRTWRRPRASRRRPLELTVWSGDERRSWSTSLDALPAVDDDLREPWLFVPPEIAAIFDQMWESSEPLGGVDPLQPQRGLMTGCNRAFVLDDCEAEELLGGCAGDWTRPVLSGRDIRAGEVDPAGRLLWGYDGDMEVLEEVPESFREYFAERAETLEGRADFNPGRPLWQLFRLKSGLLDPKVVWRDLAPRLEAAVAPAEVVPLNTVYFIPFDRRAEARSTAALFNSEPLRAYAYALGERARGGWRRHFCWVMRMLPIPEAYLRRIRADEGGDDRCDREDDRWAGDLYGLDADALRTLREWRCRPSSSERAEAA